ncbi:class I SAM-dependent methyltransferase [Achromobacter spanius]|uniref:class I SAM-dependent methyltransferase n=1 Tax=Achromobacter spanius TaxID=217203 RepID=UPI000F8FB834|nr:class I SAM-dependent methyltransferase [Achromobacter spanius]AZS78749.1 class I SAM-dependent methyltransferase [Achromobacter spanius]
MIPQRDSPNLRKEAKVVQGDKFIRHFRSPIDGSQLRQDGNALVDQSGNSFPIFKGVPILIPNLEQLFEDHYRISKETGCVIDGAQEAPFTAYVLGFRITISALGNKVDSTHPVGTLFDVEGQPAVILADGAHMVHELSLHTRPPETTWGDIKAKLACAAPYLLLDKPFPTPVFPTYYELIGHGAEIVLGTRQEEPKLAGNADTESEHHDRLELLNAEYFSAITRGFGLPIDKYPVLDIGCDTGFLTRALLRAGATEAIGTDLRPSSFSDHQWLSNALTPGLANMFHWCYPQDGFSVIAVRNNSAFAFASHFDAPFESFLQNCLASLRDDGALYLTFLTNGSGVPGADGFANKSIAEIVHWINDQGATILKMMRLGTMLGFWLAKGENLVSSVRRHAQNARMGAFVRYSESANARHDQALAIADFASEIALNCYLKGATKASLWGSGILSYQTWRMLSILYPDIAVEYVVRSDKTGKSVFQIFSHRDASPGAIHVLVDDAYYERRSCGLADWWKQRRFLTQFPDGLTFFSPSSNPSPGPFPFLSGDHDLTVAPDLARIYFRGRLRPTSTLAEEEDEAAFEGNMKYQFPTGFAGV